MTPTSYEYNVFINCPFDDEYADMFYALVFAVHDCGFRARCTLEIDDTGRVRLESILDLISECSLGIHDISRTELDETYGLPRFNMPFELGLFLGASRFGQAEQQAKKCLVLDREPYRYQKFLSDISGQDPKAHEAEPATVISQVRDWLNSALPEAEVIRPGGRKIAERYASFRDELPELCAEVHIETDELIFNDFTTILVEWLQDHEWNR